MDQSSMAAFRNAVTAPDAPLGEAAEILQSLTDEAIAVAQQNPDRALAMLDELLTLCTGIPRLAETTASIGYNRAALLRLRGRFAEAADGYRAVVSEFESHPDAEAVFWVALALYNHVTMELETATDEDAADRIPGLAGTLRSLCGDSTDPRIVTRVRYAMRAELALFERLDRTEQVAESRARIAEIVRPDVEVVLARLAEDDPLAADDEVGPQWAYSREQLVTSLLVDFEPCLDLVRKLADCDAAELTRAISSFPVLLTQAALCALAAAQDGQITGTQNDEDRARVAKGRDQLVAVLHHLYLNPGSYPLESGPVETLLAMVDVSMSMTDALIRARSLEVVHTLSLPYVYALAEAAMAVQATGDWRRASRLMLLLLAATERVGNTGEGRSMVTMARFRWLFVARQVLNQLPDGRVLHSAADAGRRVLASYNDETKPSWHAEALLALATLHIEPYSGSRTSDNLDADVRRWLDRLREEVVDPVEVPDGVTVTMPTFAEVVGISEDYVRQAMELAEPVQEIHLLSTMLTIRRVQAMIGQDIDMDELAAITARLAAAEGVEDQPMALANALIFQTALGQAPDETALNRLLAHPVGDITDLTSVQVAHAVLGGAGQILARTDPARGRRLFVESRHTIRSMPERERLQLLKLHQNLMIDPSDLITDADLVPQESLDTLLARAAADGWPAGRAGLALVNWFRFGHEGTDSATTEVDWSSALRAMTEHYPSFVDDHEDVLAYTVATAFLNTSERAGRQEDWAQALACAAGACSVFLELSMPDAAMESLTVIGRIVVNCEGRNLARVVVEALAPVVVPAENQIGAAATDVLQLIWSQVIGTAVWAGAGEMDAVFAGMQLAKGARFVHALHAGTAFDVQADETATRLLAAIGRPDETTGSNLDAVTLLTPYTERLDDVGDASAATRLENLQRTFDAMVQRELSAGQAAEIPLMDVATACDKLPADTILLFSYLTHSPGGGRSLLTVMITPDRTIVVPTEILSAENAGQRVELHLDNRVRVLDRLGSAVHWMRKAVQDEPGPARVVARPDEAALDEVLALFGPVSDFLREEYAAGRRHLVFVPHGPLHFAPLHLLPLDGRPLADVWTVTYLPSLALLDRPVASSDKTAVVAVGLGFPDTHDPIPEAVAEAEAVAATFGGTALVDAAATEDAVFEALAGARMFHIATHGAHNVAAPAFQRLYVADEEVSAHELLRLDLTGLDLVTLSACETALGRFDSADNLRGIPANLLLRGARTVIGTLWPVESQTSHDFFTTLYGMLHEGTPKLDAFAAAQQQTRAAHPQYRDWGAFYYVGDWR